MCFLLAGTEVKQLGISFVSFCLYKSTLLLDSCRDKSDRRLLFAHIFEVNDKLDEPGEHVLEKQNH